MKAPLLLSLCLLLTSLAHATPPNLVVFLADDAGWGDYSFSGNTQVATPNIDSIAKGGVSLDRFFVCPVCSPTRAEFLTGRYHPRTGVKGVSTGQERLNLDEKTIADAFSDGMKMALNGDWDQLFGSIVNSIFSSTLKSVGQSRQRNWIAAFAP